MTNHVQLPQLLSITTQLHIAYICQVMIFIRSRQFNRRREDVFNE